MGSEERVHIVMDPDLDVAGIAWNVSIKNTFVHIEDEDCFDVKIAVRSHSTPSRRLHSKRSQCDTIRHQAKHQDKQAPLHDIENCGKPDAKFVMVKFQKLRQAPTPCRAKANSEYASSQSHGRTDSRGARRSGATSIHKVPNQLEGKKTTTGKSIDIKAKQTKTSQSEQEIPLRLPNYLPGAQTNTNSNYMSNADILSWSDKEPANVPEKESLLIVREAVVKLVSSMNCMMNKIETSEPSRAIGIEWFHALHVFDVLCTDLHLQSPSRSLPRVAAAFILAMKRNGKASIVDAVLKELEQHLFSNNVSIDSVQMGQTIRKEEEYLCKVHHIPTVLCWIDAILSRFDALSISTLSHDLFDRSQLVSWAYLFAQRVPISGDKSPKKIAMGVCGIALVFRGVVPANSLRPAHIEEHLWRDAFAAVWATNMSRLRPLQRDTMKCESFLLLLQHASMGTLSDLQSSTGIVIEALREVRQLHFI